MKHTIGEVGAIRACCFGICVSVIHHFGTTVPPKTFAQTQFIFENMAKSNGDDKFKWDQVMEDSDLVFSRVNDIGVIQQELKA